MLHVDLKERDRDAELGFVRVVFDVVEEMVDASWDYTTLQMDFFGSSLTVHMIHRCFRPEYSVRLSTSSLSISHCDAIEPI